ncbi:MAG TPA: ABC transporter permease [Gemmatimonadales bacterium]|nr:ABC transporter permease [Gemmatimonadales bacterium]
MSLWRQVRHGFRALFQPARTDRDIRDEVSQYIDAATAEHTRRGFSPETARRAARLDIRNETAAREEIRTAGWEYRLENIMTDLRLAIRRLAHSPAFTIVTILTLALGVGATTAIFSALKPILLDPLPYPHAERVMMVSDGNGTGNPVPVTFGTYVELAARTHTFDALAVANAWQPPLLASGAAIADPLRLSGQRVSAGYFRVLGVSPAYGRDFTATDDYAAGPRVVVISGRLARERFGTSAAAIGQSLLLGGDPWTVIGVMPERFDLAFAPHTDIWAPLQYQPSASFQTREWGHHLTMIGRARAGLTVADVRHDVAAIAHARRADFPRPPWADMNGGMIVTGLQEAVARDVRPALFAIAGAVGLLLLIACVNVTNLFLARVAQRQAELTMCSALGASRGRIVAQLVTESLVVAALGGALGLAVASAGVHAFVAISPAQLPRVDAIRLDQGVFAFALLLTAGVGIVVGFVPAWRVSGNLFLERLHQSSRRVAARQTTRRTLVIAEVALATVLLVGAGLLLRSVSRLLSVTPGFDAENIATMQVALAGHRYDSTTARYEFFERALEAVRQLPGVTTAAFTTQLPLSGDLDSYGTQFEGLPDSNATASAALWRYVVTADYFRAMHIPLVRGRLFDQRDGPSSAEAVLLSASYAKRVFGDRDPIGQRMRAGPEIGDSTRPWATVVGVVGDVKQQSLAFGQTDAFYVPLGEWPWVDGVQSLVVRTSVAPITVVPAIRRAIWSVDREPITRATTMEDLVAGSEAQRHFALSIFEVFALAALALAGIGLYGILAGSVTERTREIGVRAALGATQSEIVALVVREGLMVALTGLAIGVVITFEATRAVGSLLFGISRFDLATYLAVAGILTAVAVAACWIPAWRGARVDPNVALRAE